MKFKIKRYKSNIQGKFYEKSNIFKKRLSQLWESFVDKGHEKMTIMFIPHNEKNIFNFQISKFTISFFVFLFAIVLSTSTYAVIQSNAVKREEKRLLTTYNDIRAHLLRFEKMTHSIDSEMEDMKPLIEELYGIAASSNDVEELWKNVEIQATGQEGDDLSLPREIYTIRQLQQELECTTNTIKTVKNFLDVRSKVIKDTPSIVPNQGHITSLFGWRRSPFGHGRDFHTGIDIAAASGTIIRATAPGMVASAGWGGGYGNMIRITHKYGFETVYGHCQSIVAPQGKFVQKGEIIGYVGRTGNATGNHCHYEVRLGGIPINPYPYMSRVW